MPAFLRPLPRRLLRTIRVVTARTSPLQRLLAALAGCGLPLAGVLACCCVAVAQPATPGGPGVAAEPAGCCRTEPAGDPPPCHPQPGSTPAPGDCGGCPTAATPAPEEAVTAPPTEGVRPAPPPAAEPPATHATLRVAPASAARRGVAAPPSGRAIRVLRESFQL